MNKNRMLQIISVVGLFVFCTVFLSSLFFADRLEQSALSFIKLKTTEKLQLKVDQLTGVNSESPTLAQKIFLQKYRTEVPKLKNDIQAIVEIIGDAQANNVAFESQQLDAMITGFHYSSQLWEYELIQKSFGALSTFAKERYTQTWQALNQDFRLFSAINAGSFFLIFLISFVIVPLPKYIEMVCWILTLSTLVCIYFYLFGQNWLYTVLFHQFYGTGYLALLSVMFLYLLFEGTVSFISDMNTKSKQ